jgi:hypothetical protein
MAVATANRSSSIKTIIMVRRNQHTVVIPRANLSSRVMHIPNNNNRSITISKRLNSRSMDTTTNSNPTTSRALVS